MFLLIFSNFYYGASQPDEELDIETASDHIGLSILSFGAVLMTYLSYSSLPRVTIGVIISGASFIEGISAFRFYQKVESIFRRRSLEPVKTGSLKRKSLAGLFCFSFMIIALWIVIGLQIWGPFDFGIRYNLQLFWTITVIFTTLFGLSAKYWTVTKEISTPTFISIIFIISGAQIYNFSNFRTDILVFFLSKMLFVLGYYMTIVGFIKTKPDSGTSLIN